MSLSKSFLSKTENLRPLREYVGKAARNFGFSEEEISNIILAVDEACTNVIRHAYHYQTDKAIEILIEGSDGRFEVRILDSGDPFDPATLQPFNLKEHLSSYKRGGLGIYLMKSLMDKVEYRPKKEGKNEVRLIKYRQQALKQTS